MTPDEVRAAWPDEYREADQAMRAADDTASGVVVLMQTGTLKLEEAKRIILAIQNGMTLEEFEAGDFPFVRQYMREVEEHWRRGA